MNKKVSVILPIYNAQIYLKECIDSLLNQTYRNIEIIAIDDGSTDDSLKILGEYSRRDSRLKIVKNEENKGLIYTLNRGIDLADGEYIARMDSDDICELDRFEQQVRYLEKNESIDVLGTWMRTFGEKEGIWCPPIKNEMLITKMILECCICHPSVIMRTKFIKDNNIKYDEEFIDAEDYELWCRIQKKGKIENLPQVLINYRITNTSISSTKIDSMKRSTLKVIKRNMDSIGLHLNFSELKLLELIVNKEYKTCKVEIKNIRKLMIKILRCNSKFSSYNEKYLMLVLDSKMLEVFCGAHNNKVIAAIEYYVRYSIYKRSFIYQIKNKLYKLLNK